MNDERIFETAQCIANRWQELSPEQQKRLSDIQPFLMGAVDDLVYEFNRKRYRGSLNYDWSLDYGLRIRDANIEPWPPTSERQG